MAACSLTELMFALGLAATVAAAALPQARASLDDQRARGAARYLATRLQRTRMEAVTRNQSAALRVGRTPSGFSFIICVDGNHNGVLSRDIQTGVDRIVAPSESLSSHFPGVDFGAGLNLPAVDAASSPPGTDPIRLGSSDMVVFASTGTATPGSLYIRGRSGAQYVVRIFGETGRTRVLKFNPRSWQWTPLQDS